TCSRSSCSLARRNCTKSVLVSSTTSTASGRIRRKISVVKVPTPGPYSRKTRARFQSTCESTWFTRKRELGIRLPSILGCLRKLRPNSRICSERHERGSEDTGGMISLSTPAGEPARRRLPGAGGRRAQKHRPRRWLVLGAVVPHLPVPLDIAFLHGGVCAHGGVAGHNRGVLRGPRSDHGVGRFPD